MDKNQTNSELTIIITDIKPVKDSTRVAILCYI